MAVTNLDCNGLILNHSKGAMVDQSDFCCRSLGRLKNAIIITTMKTDFYKVWDIDLTNVHSEHNSEDIYFL